MTDCTEPRPARLTDGRDSEGQTDGRDSEGQEGMRKVGTA